MQRGSSEHGARQQQQQQVAPAPTFLPLKPRQRHTGGTCYGGVNSRCLPACLPPRLLVTHTLHMHSRAAKLVQESYHYYYDTRTHTDPPSTLPSRLLVYIAQEVVRLIRVVAHSPGIYIRIFMLGPEGSCLTSVLFDFASKPFLSQRRQREQQLQFFKSVGIIVILG